MTNPKETLEQFTERMSKVAKEEEFHIGNAMRGNSRAVFKFEGQYCYLESRGYSSYPTLPNPARAVLMTLRTPSDYWWTDYMSYGKRRANKIAKHYNATVNEAPYAKEDNKWFYYVFQEFEDMMRLVHDRHTGKFIELHGKEPTLYVDCINEDETCDMNIVNAEERG